MSSPTVRCSICRSMLDEEDLFCSNCGTEGMATAKEADLLIEQQASLMSFKCESCGASMSYDASAQSLRCPFCGGQQLRAQKDARTLRPNWVVPFRTRLADAENALRTFLASGFWRPGDASRASMIGEVTQVFVPFWIFSAKTSTYWTGDSSSTPAGARGSWYPQSGDHRGNYANLLVVASSMIGPREMEGIQPFDLSAAVSPQEVDLVNVIVEEFRVPRKFARPQAVSLIEQYETSQCAQYIAGRTRNVRVNVQISEMKSEPVLLPIWIMVYRYKDHSYRVLINGQTAKVAGNAPFSYAKLSVVVVLVVVVLILILGMILLAGLAR